MRAASRFERAGRDERGMAMVMAVTLAAVMALLGIVVLQNSTHADRASQRGRNWEAALHVAESGVQKTVAYLQATGGAVPAPFSGATADGTYDVTVTYLGRNRYQIDSRGTAGGPVNLAATRAIRVVMGPPRSFKFGLFSLTDIDTKNNNHVAADVWANGSVRVFQNDVIEGSATAATGWAVLDNGSEVGGDVQSGGYDPATGIAIEVSTNAHIGGKATASSTSPGCSDDPTGAQYGVHVVGSITGAVTTWGAKTGSGGTGTLRTHYCTAAPATLDIPPFTYNPANYNPAPLEFASPTAFNTWLSGHMSSLSGTFYVNGGGASEAISLNGVSIAGDTTIIAPNAPIDANGGVGIGAANSNDKVLVLVSNYAPPGGSTCTNNGGNPKDCAIGIKNNFQPSDNTATLLYAPAGPVAFKNNAEFDGAVYANNIVLKNNMDLVYDPRVEQVVGFGPVTLSVESWTERKP